MMRHYAIGDIHGQLGMLEAAHARIEKDRDAHGDPDAPVVHLGDLVDRGPETKGVLDFLIAGQAEGRPWIVLRGNHDDMFLEFVDHDERHSDRLSPGVTWLTGNVGGAATLASYGVRLGSLRSRLAIHADAVAAVPVAHRRFLSTLPFLYAAPGLLFVHAGIRPGVPITAQDREDLIWIREPFLSDPRDHGALVVHGHTPVEYPVHAGNRVDLDTGAGFGEPMTAAVFEGTDCWILTDEGRVPLTPLG